MSSSLRRTLTYDPEFHPVKVPEFHRDNSQCDITSPAELRSRIAIIETNLNTSKRFSDPTVHAVSGRKDCAQSHIMTAIINFTNMQSYYDELTSLGSLLSALRHENDIEVNMNSSSTSLTRLVLKDNALQEHIQNHACFVEDQLSPNCRSLFDLSSHTLGTGTDEAHVDLMVDVQTHAIPTRLDLMVDSLSFNDKCSNSAPTGAKQASISHTNFASIARTGGDGVVIQHTNLEKHGFWEGHLRLIVKTYTRDRDRFLRHRLARVLPLPTRRSEGSAHQRLVWFTGHPKSDIHRSVHLAVQKLRNLLTFAARSRSLTNIEFRAKTQSPVLNFGLISSTANAVLSIQDSIVKGAIFSSSPVLIVTDQ
ncbi:hypothetical protein BLNAU_10198 [Blattamonas nauphoetae]|uniref:Uncharacterized protein n=1 Tax=Blattamonas nauphoetae TaxID=2049346 RepID=A0ABQ9XTQ9_9EUKA|nr:hypothetical protein BLNAU_10198 [Blattamonas nauphoetae]